MCCVKMHSCCSEPFPFQLQPSCDRGSVHCFAGFYSAVHGGFAASEHPCDARNGALYEENLPVTEYAQYVRALVHGEVLRYILSIKLCQHLIDAVRHAVHKYFAGLLGMIGDDPAELQRKLAYLRVCRNVNVYAEHPRQLVS